MSVFLSIGSNIRPEKNIPACMELLKEKFRVEKISSIYETDPVGPAGDKKFWNLAVSVEGPRDLKNLRKKLREIEAALGRVRDGNKFAPRTIDLDILPQPGYQRLAFMMIPLAEIAPEEVDRETGKTFGELARELIKRRQAPRISHTAPRRGRYPPRRRGFP